MTPETGHLHLDDDRVLDLALGLLDSEARQAADRHLDKCAACAERLRITLASHHRALGKSLAEVEALYPGAKSRVEGPPAASGGGVPLEVRSLGPQTRHRPRSGRWLALAASVLAVGGLFLTLKTAPWGPAAPLGIELPDPDPSGLTRDLALTAPDSLVFRGLDAYRSGDRATARRLLESATTSGPLEQVRRIYLGAALLDRGEFARAAVVLRGVELDLVIEPWNGEARWMLAQALRRTGRGSAADSLLRALAEEPGEAGERARRALGR